MKLNNSQARHLANSLRAYGLGQMAAFGYAGVLAGEWYLVAGSGVLLVLFEGSALAILKGVKEAI